MLEINTKIEKGNVNPNTKNSGRRIANQQDLDRLIESYDQQVYGPTTEPILKSGEQPKYDARAEMERLKEIEAHGGRGSVNLEGRNIPRDIVESILNNPLDLKPIEDTKMSVLEEKLANNGLKNAVDIFNKVEKKDQEAKAKLNEQLSYCSTENSNINYDALKQLIEECLDKKLNEIKQTLNESVSHQNYVPSMKFLSFKDNFYFVDNDDNVFECIMKYKGKRKTSNK